MEVVDIITDRTEDIMLMFHTTIHRDTDTTIDHAVITIREYIIMWIMCRVTIRLIITADGTGIVAGTGEDNLSECAGLLRT